MEQVLAATIQERDLTNSNLPEDIYRFLETSELYIKYASRIVPKHFFFINDEWEWALPYSDTTAFEAGYGEFNEPDFIESPLMPPMKRYQIELEIRNIKRGPPSYCDDIES